MTVNIGVEPPQKTDLLVKTSAKVWRSILLGGAKVMVKEWLKGGIQFGPGSFFTFLKFMSNLDTEED